MKVTAYQTKIVNYGDNLEEVLFAGLPQKLPERSIIAVTSKIVSLCEKNAVKIPTDEVEAKKLEIALIEQESEKYCRGSQRYEILLGWRDGKISARAGIDKLNTGGYFVLWPDDLQASARRIWQWLRKTYQLEEVGVIITDSHVQMGRWGVIGTALAHCGFVALKNSVGERDLFGESFAMTHVAVSEALAVAAVFEMGETNEAKPLAVISDLKEVEFQEVEPSREELQAALIAPEDDLFADFLQGPDWHQGKRKAR